MQIKKYPYLWQLNFIDFSEINFDFDNFHPYLELYQDNSSCTINPYISRIDKYILLDKRLLISYIKILSKIRLIYLTNPLNENLEDKEYIVNKGLYRQKYIKDNFYIFKKCVDEAFSNNILYFNKEDNYYILFIDANKTKENIEKIERIIEVFLDIDFDIRYFFNHILLLELKGLDKLESWVLL